MNLYITYSELTKTFLFKLNDVYVDLKTVINEMISKKHICLPSNFWLNFKKTNNELDMISLPIKGRNLGIFLIPIIYQAVGVIFVLGCAAGLYIKKKWEEDKMDYRFENKKIPPNAKIEDVLPSYVENRNQIQILVFYLANILEGIRKIGPDVLEIIEDGIELYRAPSLSQGLKTANDIKKMINKVNSIAIPSTRNDVDFFDYSTDNVGINNIERIFRNNAGLIPFVEMNRIRSFFENDGARGDPDTINRSLDYIRDQILRSGDQSIIDLLTNIYKNLENRRDNIRDLKKNSVYRYELYETEEEKEKDDPDFYNLIPFVIWRNPSLDLINNDFISIKTWFYWGKWECSPVSYDYNTKMDQQHFFNILLKREGDYPWNEQNTIIISDVRKNRSSRKATAHIYFKEYNY